MADGTILHQPTPDEPREASTGDNHQATNAAREIALTRPAWEAMTADERRVYADPTKRCAEKGCTEPAGTPWGPYWCADHDDERIHRISRQLNGIVDTLHAHRIQERMTNVEVGP